MAVAVTNDWLSSGKLIPSWALSVLFHALMLVATFWLMPVMERAPVGFQDERAQEIGIYVKEPGDQVEPSDAVAAEQETSTLVPQASGLSDPLSPQKVVPDKIPIATPLPERESVVPIGPGAPISPPIPSEVKGTSKAPGGASRRKGGTTGTPGAAFMGTKDVGQRVVFVIDCSHSMLENQAMQLAKGALVSSINALEPTQMFQVVFYNETTLSMPPKVPSKEKLHLATEANKMAAYRFIRGIDPSLGTSHFKAINEALTLKPDMIFVLTDSGDPKLTPKELDDLKNRNKGRVRIHTIEFGIGPALNSKQDGNFLVNLARENQGTYRYVDVLDAKLRKRSGD